MEKLENAVSVGELEKELVTKEVLKSQLENALQQILGQITCLKSLVKKAKGENKPVEKTDKEEIK